MGDEAIEQQIANVFADLKKKKKPKKVVVVEEEPQITMPEKATEPVADMFGDLKKKKKKKDIPMDFEVAEGDTAANAAPEVEPADASLSMFGDKKKKKKKTTFEDFEAQIRADDEGEVPDDDVMEETKDEEPWLSSNRDYTYSEVFNIPLLTHTT
ncbi:hypothetical protein HDU91_002535 [Kappamyces sp. JEL0680]|nr:hypothetical protein HDU91_002535 [Kappamyces sp. JEL0680]